MRKHMHLSSYARALAALMATLFGFAIWAAEPRTAIELGSLGPQVGEPVPEFNLPDQFGQLQTLDSVRGPNGTMLLFFRSADW